MEEPEVYSCTHTMLHKRVHISMPMHVLIGVNINLLLQNLTREGTVHYFVERVKFDGQNSHFLAE